MIDKNIVLASSSNRRKELLTRLGIKYTSMPSKIDEDGYDYEHPEKLVQELSLAKASNVANVVEDALIIAADTVVAHDNKVLGKPKDEEDAKRMLQLLENDKHEVFTGLALISANDEMHFLDYDVTEVFMRKVEEEEIERYIKTGEPMDKAGSYGIQGKGGIFVNKIIGSYFTVMGLPVHMLSMALKSFSIEII